MKVGDLVRMKNDTALGIIMTLNIHSEPSLGICWYVFYFMKGKGMTLPLWESQMELISESG